MQPTHKQPNKVLNKDIKDKFSVFFSKFSMTIFGFLPNSESFQHREKPDWILAVI